MQILDVYEYNRDSDEHSRTKKLRGSDDHEACALKLLDSMNGPHYCWYTLDEFAPIYGILDLNTNLYKGRHSL